MFKRLITRLLVLIMSIAILGCGGASFMNGNVYAANEGSTTRAEWLSQLVNAFDMTVEDDNMPEDYYPDVSSGREDYKDIMMAVEFGVINLEPGSELRPDDPVTREFAADTMAYCLGYEDDGETEYTFSDPDAVENDFAAQIAVERGWFALTDGAFMPDQEVTEAEISVMLADAKSLLGQTEIDPSYDNKFEFADGVVEIPNGTDVTVNEDETEVVIAGTKYADQLTPGALFAVYMSDYPLGYKVSSTSIESGNTVVAVETADDQEILTYADAEGVMEGDLTDFVPADGVEIIDTEEESQQADTGILKRFAPGQLRATHKLKSITVSKTYPIGQGVTFSPTFKISNISLEYKTRWLKYAYAGVKADITIEGQFNIDVLDALGYEASLPLGYLPVAGGAGYVRLDAVIALDGTITATASYHLYAGVEKEAGQRTRTIREFKETSFHIHLVVNGKLGVKLQAGFGDGKLLDGNIHAEVGIKAKLIMDHYYDGKQPEICTSAQGWVYAKYGAKIAAFKGAWKLAQEEVDIWTYKNSPKKASFHWEDGVLVSYCKRHPEDPFWFTKFNSRYASISGGYGLNDEGELVPVFTFEVRDGEAYITGYTGNGYTLDIPETVSDENGEYTVVGIAEGAFNGRQDIHYIIFPDTVTDIKHDAFSGCTSLSSLDLPDNLTDLDYHAFAEDTALASVDVPKSLEWCGYSMFGAGPFYNCSGLKTVNFEQGIVNIPAHIFDGCTGIEEITIPDTVTTIEDNAFKAATGLKKVVISDSVTRINHDAFAGCTALSEVSLSKGLTYLDYDVFSGDTALTSIEIPKSLDTCQGSTFGGGPFVGCSGLKNVTFETGVTQIPMDLFNGCTGIEEITIPDTVTTIEDNAFNAATSLRKVVIPDSVTSIDHDAFAGCTALSEVNLPKRLTYLGYDVFSGDTALTSIEIPKSLDICQGSTFGGGPFAGCSGLKNVTFEEGADQIAQYLFDGCTGIEEITIPDTVTVIEAGAFRKATNLKKITVPEGVTVINNYAFQNCTSLSDVKLPESLNRIYLSVFEGDTSLKSITIPSSVKNIGNNTFANSGLTEITIPEGVEIMGSSMFSNCSELTKAVISDTVTSLGGSAFAECDKLTDVTLGEGITTLPASAFSGCDVLEKVVLPHAAAKVEANAFKECVSMKEITMFRNVTSIASSAFSYPEKVTIYGVAGTYPETFASENSIKFVAIDNPATAVQLDQSQLTLNNGASAKLRLTVTPADYTDAVSWKSNNEDVVTVSDGKVTAKGVGSASVRASVGSVNATCSITVVQPVTSITLNKTTLSLEGGSTYQLTATPKPDTAEDKTVTWSSSNENVATVSEDGLVTAVAKGTADITVTSAAAPTVSNTCKVTVTNTKIIAESVDELESPHPYENSCTDSWSYTDKGAAGLIVTFSDQTLIDDFGDYLDIYNSDGSLQGEYTGSALAGQSVEVSGDTVVIRFKTDGSDTAWGFRVTSVERVEAPCEHDWSEWTVTKEASCTEDGLKTRTCSICGETETEVIEATGHTAVVIKGKDATCTEPGLTEGEKCSVCGEIITAQTEIPALGHEYDAVVTEPTCTEPGYTTYTCIRGDHEYVGDEKPALGHDWGKWEVDTEATEESEGLEIRACGRCGETEERTIPALDHQHALSHVEAKDATCTEAGNVEYWVCTKCGLYFSDKEGENQLDDVVIPALGHEYEAEVTEPTCTEAGYTTHKCIYCDYEYTDSETAALGHSLVKAERVEPTYEAEGCKEHWKCGRCGRLFSDAEGRTEVTEEDLVIPKYDKEEQEKADQAISDSEEAIATAETEEGKASEQAGEAEATAATDKPDDAVIDSASGAADAAIKAAQEAAEAAQKALDAAIAAYGEGSTQALAAETMAASARALLASTTQSKAITAKAAATSASKKAASAKAAAAAAAATPGQAAVNAANTAKTAADGAAAKAKDAKAAADAALEAAEDFLNNATDDQKAAAETAVENACKAVSDAETAVSNANNDVTAAAAAVKDAQTKKAAAEARAAEAARQGKLNTKLPKLTISKPAAAKKAVTVKWKKLTSAKKKKVQKIEIWVCPNKTFGAKDTVIKTVSKGKASYKVKGLKARKKYYIKVRTIKYVNGVKNVSKWSKVKSIKTK